MEKETRHIVLFDGVCNLCSGAVQYIIRRDKRAQFKFASLQSEVGRQLLLEKGLPQDHSSSFVYIQGENVYLKSEAALRVARELDGISKWLYGLIIIPSFIRDFVYRCVAQNRYRIFGKKQTCMIPSPPLKERFLD